MACPEVHFRTSGQAIAWRHSGQPLRSTVLQAAESIVIDDSILIMHPRDIVMIERVPVAYKTGSKALQRVSGRMDVESAVELDPVCDACLAEGVRSLIIDLSGLTYISSMGLRSLVTAAKKLAAKGGTLRIAKMNGLVRQVFEITNLARTFPTYETVEAAVSAG